MEIEKVVNDKFKEIVDEGFIEEKIKEQLKSTVENVVKDQLRSYSDFGKNLEAQIKEALNIANLKFSLPEYNRLVCNHVETMVNETITGTVKDQITANLKELFDPLEKQEWKLSEIIEKFIEDIRSDIDDEYGEITLHIENKDFEYKYIYFDQESDKSKYSCAYQFGLDKENKLWRLEIKDSDMSKVRSPLIYGFDSFLFKLFSVKGTIIIDENQIDLEYHNYED